MRVLVSDITDSGVGSTTFNRRINGTHLKRPRKPPVAREFVAGFFFIKQTRMGEDSCAIEKGVPYANKTSPTLTSHRRGQTRPLFLKRLTWHGGLGTLSGALKMRTRLVFLCF